MAAFLSDRGEQEAFANTVEGVEASDAAAKLCLCGRQLVMRHYPTVDRIKLLRYDSCDMAALCPLCAIRRASKRIARYLGRVEREVASSGLPDGSTLKACMVTLTVKNGENLAERMAHLRTGVQRMRQRRNQARSGNGRGSTQMALVEGAVGSYEVTNQGNGWHPHVHILCLAWTLPDPEALRSEWHRSTGDSFVIDVSPIVGGLEKGFAEVFKYALKFSGMTLPDNWEAYRTLRRQRLVFSFGCLYGVPDPTPEELGEEPLEGLPFVDLLFQWLPKSQAYTLAREIPGALPERSTQAEDPTPPETELASGSGGEAGKARPAPPAARSAGRWISARATPRKRPSSSRPSAIARALVGRVKRSAKE
jgi:hypothetical protein